MLIFLTYGLVKYLVPHPEFSPAGALGSIEELLFLALKKTKKKKKLVHEINEKREECIVFL